MNSASDLAMLGRVMGGLIVVLVLVGLTARIARRARGTSGSTGLRVVDRIGLSREANLAVVEVSNRTLLLGVTSQGVTMLADLDDAGHRDAQHVAQHLAGGRLETGPTAPAVGANASPPGVHDHGKETRGEEDRGDEAGQPAASPMPTGVLLGDHPDLASALRAAGRTTDSATATSTSDPEPGSPEADDSTPSTGPTVPRTRAEVRAQKTSGGRGWIPRQRTPAGPTASTPETARSDRTKRIVPPPAAQASGSVLSPGTWRQGLEALRELTVRR